MSDPVDTAADAQPTARKPAGRHFRPARVAMDRAAAERQGRIAQVAFLTLGNRDDAIAFLNTHDDALGQRPIDAAVASDEGLAAAERLLAERANGGKPANLTLPPVT